MVMVKTRLPLEASIDLKASGSTSGRSIFASPQNGMATLVIPCALAASGAKLA